MKIIDAHTHIFDVLAGFGSCGELRPIGNGVARWATGEEMAMIPPELGDRCFPAQTLASLLRDQGVEKAVLLQGGLYGFQNDATLAAAKAYPDLFIPSGTFDPFCGRAADLAERLLLKEHLRIMKFEASSGVGLMSNHPPFALDGDVMAETFALMARVGATLVLDIGSYGMGSYQPQAVANIAWRHPSMPIVVCHLTAPGPQDAEPLRQTLTTLRLPNVWFDLSAIPWNVAPEAYPYPTGQAYIRMAKDLVGAEKLIWGTDVPVVLTRDTYSHLLSYLTESDIFTPSELEKVLYQNAVDAFQLPS